MLYRLRNDFQLSIITLLGVSALLGIFPFAVFRFFNGETVGGLVDLAILSAIIGGVSYAWVTGRTRMAGIYMCVMISIGGAAVGVVIGAKAVFWLYPVFVTSFFLAPAALAVLCNLSMLAVVVLVGHAFNSLEAMMSFVATSMVVSCCAYIFARRNEDQRQRLEMMATHDPLTGTKNRRAMEEELKAATMSFERNGVPHALMILDLDHFKNINDTLGHGVGDVVLSDLAELIRRHTRLSDGLFRFGGEEFVILMPGIRPEALASVAENLRHKIHTELRGPRGLTITASFGAASLQIAETDEQWFERADAALYQAKEAGRNRVVVADHDTLDENDAMPELTLRSRAEA